MSNERKPIDNIRIRQLQPGDNFAGAKKVCIKNNSTIVRSLTLQNVASIQFFIFTGITHLALCIIFRPPTDLGIQLLLLLCSSVLQLLHIVTFFYRLFFPHDSRDFEGYWSQPHRRFLVAEDITRVDNPVVATLAIEKREDDPTVTEFFRMRVLSSHQRRGLARRLSEKGEELAKEVFAAKTLRVTTSPRRKAALVLYRQFGFQNVRKVDKPGCYPMQPTELIVLQKILH